MTISTTTSTKRKRTRTGSSLAWWLLALALLSLPAAAREKKKQPQPSATVAGTVFREPGFALPGAEVTVTPESDRVEDVKLKKEKVLTNTRGEWAVRVPPVPMKYQVDVKYSGYESQQKSVSIEGEHRREVNFVLAPKSETKAPGRVREEGK
jgi:hypothetical protein